MRESLRRLPPAYVRGSYPNQSAESLPLPSRNDQEQSLPFRRNDAEQEEEDLPPYSKADPLVDGDPEDHVLEAETDSNTPTQLWIPGRAERHLEISEEEEEDDDRARYARDVVDHLWQEAQQTNQEGDHHPRTSFERRERTVAPPHDCEPDLESYASNVETTSNRPLRRRKRNICCECSKLCWAWWMFWALVIIIPAVVAAVKTF